MSAGFKPCASPSCSSCQEVVRLRVHLSATRAYVDDPGNFSAWDGRRAILLALLDGTS